MDPRPFVRESDRVHNSAPLAARVEQIKETICGYRLPDSQNGLEIAEPDFIEFNFLDTEAASKITTSDMYHVLGNMIPVVESKMSRTGKSWHIKLDNREGQDGHTEDEVAALILRDAVVDSGVETIKLNDEPVVPKPGKKN